MSNRTVGQILFVMKTDDTSLVPVLVVEELVRKTLAGEETTHTVEALTQGGTRKRFTLSDAHFHVFDDVETARQYLVHNATNAINMLCESAVKKSHQLLGEINTAVPREKVREQPVQEHTEVLLSDGTKAKINLPPGF
jgi:hypothetical protein